MTLNKKKDKKKFNLIIKNKDKKKDIKNDREIKDKRKKKKKKNRKKEKKEIKDIYFFFRIEYFII